MIIELKVPSPGESVSEAVIAQWLVSDGDHVVRDQEVAEIESEKATLPLIAIESGRINLLVAKGETVKVGSIVCTIDNSIVQVLKSDSIQNTDNQKKNSENTKAGTGETAKLKVSPVAKRMMEANRLSTDQVIAGLTRISKEDVESVISSRINPDYQDNKTPSATSRYVERIKMSQLRKKLSTRLVVAKNQTAMLTTFNEVDMSTVLTIRNKYQDEFTAKFGVRLGLMSFFTKAVVEALKVYPDVNSMIDGEDIVHYKYADIGIAVQTPKGLMVPVLKNADSLSFAEIEAGISHLAEKARNNRITIEELTGGTFTITNGGIFGSFFSTPILNPPQAAILGMHSIVERPVAVKGNIEIRPMMYVAMSYDHRLIDGRDSVGFLIKVKDFIENPLRMLLGNKNYEEILLGIK